MPRQDTNYTMIFVLNAVPEERMRIAIETYKYRYGHKPNAIYCNPSQSCDGMVPYTGCNLGVVWVGVEL